MPKQRPSFKGEEKFDAQAARLRASLADQLSNAFGVATGFGPGDPLDFGLNRRGKMTLEERRGLGQELGRNQTQNRTALEERARGAGSSDRTKGALREASNRGFQDSVSQLGTSLEKDKGRRQRADLSEIFGGVLQRGAVGLSGMGQGALKEPDLKRNRSDKFFDGVKKGLSIFGF